MKKMVLTTKGMMNCAARYLCNKSFIDNKLPEVHLSFKKWQNVMIKQGVPDAYQT